MEGAPPAKRRKSKNKFKPAAESAAQTAAPPPAAAALHSTAAKQAKKKKKKRRKHAAAADETVAAQPDAPGAVQQQRQPPPPPPAAGRGGAPGRPAFAAPPPGSGGKKGKGGGSLLQQMRQRLQGGRFRWLNETLYTTDGSEALRLMNDQPELMQQYHEGFREQTKGWPVQPVDQAIRWLRGKPASWAVADLGCGDAKIAATVQQTVHSFDLVATAPGVVACNMAAVPLPDGAVDAAVFCLSLMGTDYGAFLQEAARILKPGGWLWIAEVQSRFVGGADGGGGGGGSGSVLPAFLAALGALGFAVRRQDTSNSHFLVLELQRHKDAGGGGGGGKQRRPAWPTLRACQYKKR